MRSTVAMGLILVVGVWGATVAATSTKSKKATAAASVTILHPTSTSLTTGMVFGRVQTNAAHSTGGTVVLTSAPPATVTASSGVQLVGGGSAPSPAIYSIKGDVSRAYIVTFPQPTVPSSPAGGTVSKFTLWTANSGNISPIGLGHLSATGVDTLRVGATLTIPGGLNPTNFTAVVPVTISYQ